PVDDESAVAVGRTALVDVLANDGLEDPSAVRLLLVDPAVPKAEDQLVDALDTDLGALQVVGPDTEPADLPEGWEAPGHPVLALTPAPDRPNELRTNEVPPVEVAYAVVDPTGATARAVLTVVPDPGAGPTSP